MKIKPKNYTKMKSKLSLILGAAMAITSCAEAPIETPSVSSNEVSFSFGGIVTKVTGTEFDLGDEILVQAYNEDGSIYGVKQYSYEGSRSFGSDDPFLFTSEIEKLSYLSVYPSDVTNEDSVFTAVAESDQSVAENFEHSDVLAASIAATDNLNPELKFKHVMSNLTIKINVVNEDGLAVEYDDIAFKAILSQDCDLKAGKYAATAGATAEAVTPKSMGSNIYSMVLASQTLKLNGDFATITVDGMEVNMPTDSDKSVTLTPGYMDKFTWDITVNGGTVVANKVTKIGGSIDEWGTTGGDGGTTTPDPGTDPEVTPSGDDMLSKAGWDTSFEDTSKGGWMNFLWGGVYNMNTISNSTSQAHTGSHSTYFQIESKGGMAGGFRGPDQAQISLPVVSGKSYDVTFWMYVETMPENANLSVFFGGNKSGYIPVTDLLTTPTKTWVKKTTTVEATGSDILDLLLFCDLSIAEAGDGEFNFYIDDISMCEHGGTTGGGSTGGDGGSTGGDSGSTGENMLVAAGWDPTFENSAAGFWKNFDAWGGIYTKNTVSTSTAQAHGGTHSTYFQVESNGGTVGSFRTTGNIALPLNVDSSASYTVGFWVYVESVPADGALSVVFSNNNSDYVSTDILSVPLNEWTYKSVTIKPYTSGSYELLLFSALENCQAGEFNFYVDDLTMTQVGGSTGGGSTVTGSDMLSPAGWDCSFEDTAKGSWMNFNWGNAFNMNTITNSTAQAHTGSHSTYFQIESKGGMAGGFRGPDQAQIALPVVSGKSYEVTFWMYVETMPENANLSIFFAGNKSGYIPVTDLLATAKNTWVKKTTVVEATGSDILDMMLFCDLSIAEAGDGEFNFYIDDISMCEK